MPRGQHPNSRKNLIVPTSEQARINGAKGGRKKAERDKVYRDIRECMKEKLTKEESARIADMLIEKSLAGNLRALEFILKMMGSDISESKSTLEALQAEKLKKEISGEISDVKVEIKFDDDMSEYDS